MLNPTDLQRLIEIITEEVMAAQNAGAPGRCVCHSVLYECCPDRLRGVLKRNMFVIASGHSMARDGSRRREC